MNTENDNFWNDPSSPFYNALDEDRGDKERDLNLGAFVFHLEGNEIDDLHDRVHDNIGDWFKNRLACNDVDISDIVRMASHCLSNVFAGGFMKNLEETGTLSDDDVILFARACIQAGYAMRQDEGDGELSL